MDHREPSSRLVAWATHGLMVAAFLLWGGMGRLDTPEAPEFFNVFRPQDIIMAITSAFLTFRLVANNNLPKTPFVLSTILFILLAYGTLIGIVTGNSLINIAFEARLFIYVLAGTLIGLSMYPGMVNRMIQFYAMIVSTGIVMQFALSLLKIDFSVISGFNPGNAFTLNLPMVRPPGGFHLVAIGLILTVVARKYEGWGFSTLIMMLALIVTQSKTYWSIVPLIMLTDALVNKHLSGLLRMIVTGFMLAVLSVMVLGFASYLTGAGWTFALPLEKFRLFLTDPEITYGVIGKRVQETQILVSAWSDSLRSILLGNGWGYLYRDPFLLFYRSDPRDQEILGMFSHNFFLWLLVKIGLIGFFVFLGALTLSMWSALKGNHEQKQLAIGLMALCFSSIFLGSPENPTGAFLFGVLLSSAPRHGRRKVSNHLDKEDDSGV